VDYSERFTIKAEVFYLFVFIFLIAKASIILNAASSLISGEFVQFAYNNAINRYENFEEVSQVSLLERIGTIVFLMSGSLCASIQKKKFLAHCLLLFMILVSSVELSRLGVLFVFVTYFIEFIIRNNKSLQLTSNFKLLKIGAQIMFGLLLIFIFSAYFRISSNHDDVIGILLLKLAVYTIAMYEAVLIWMSSNIESYFSTFGTQTFAGIYKILGLSFDQGFYASVDTRFGTTNIYTNLRGFFSDFGIIGTSFIFFIFGYILSWYSKNNMSFFSYFIVRLFLLMSIFMLYSPMIFFNIVVAFLFSGILIAGLKLTKKYIQI
tara:strand:+ start:12246 stop:13208 length:963 start_codon:yes stop_codon:yes gene_type:complete